MAYLYQVAILVAAGIAYAINLNLPYVSALFLSLIFGLAIGNLVALPTAATGILTFNSKNAMRAGIALLGFQITVHNFVEIGWRGFAAIVIVMLVTFFSTKAAAKYLKFGHEFALLLATGFSICGASAVAAVGEVRKSAKDEISYAVGLVTLLGTLSIFVLPSVARVLQLSHTQSGAWIGAAVHDVGQVVATASLVGGSTLKYAIVTKLSRVVMLAPMLLMLTPRQDAPGRLIEHPSRRPLVPFFILAFSMAVVMNNFLPISPEWASGISNLSRLLMSMGLFAMGTSVKIAELRKLGIAPVLFGVAAWLSLGVFSIRVVTWLVQ